jgi:HAD superfamily hydrolase (TIGR01509 family)
MDRSTACGLVIFDCDGVLVDTKLVECEVLSELLAELRLPLTAAQIGELTDGLTDDETWLLLSERFTLLIGEEFKQRYWTSVTDRWRSTVRPIENVEDVIKSILRAGIPVCIASGGTREQMEVTLAAAGLLHYFAPNYFSTSQVARSKPAPDVFLYAAKAMGVAPAQCVVIEDGAKGVKAAVAGGMTVLGYMPSTAVRDLASLGAITFSDMRQVPALLQLDS